MHIFTGWFGICSRSFLRAAGLLALGVLIVSAAATRTPHNQSSTPQDANKLSFDAASIKEWKSSEPTPKRTVVVGVQVSPGRLTADCTSLKGFLNYAYHATSAVPVNGLPDWADASCGAVSPNTFSIQATMPPETTDEQARQMMQTLLADRFKLAVHWEKKDMPIFALVIRPEGFKIKPFDPKNAVPFPQCPEDDRRCRRIGGGGGGPLSQLASMLSFNVGRPVIDKTGLTGDYDFTLMWAGDTTENSSLPSLPTALREKFGLELKPQTGPVNILIVDHVEKPSPN
jgi:uncharacterized protein (TIGR03435 family)